ncbi:hypothetical protein EGW08_013184 [Elysia chlorotica]|uniref:Uncharacterized protein n=1 Tax=Elysia chlorotica TaxID=188477 RepID=A0A433TBW4_ELYCH|nr:hypothetical protein EGW08_013184 [Elysia chlorotica]
MFVSAVVVLVALYFLIDRLLRVFKVGNHSNKHVFITGCDTGFGRDLALRLDTLGFPVFAGCLTSSGLESLAKVSSSRLVTLRLDVTDPDSVREAEKFELSNGSSQTSPPPAHCLKVCLLEPGYHRTPILNLDVIGEKIDKAYLRANPEVRKAYGGESFTARWKALTAAALEFSSKNTSNVVDAYVDALTARFPRPRYVVGWDARLLFVPLSFLPEWVGDRIQLWGEQAKLREQGFDA